MPAWGERLQDDEIESLHEDDPAFDVEEMGPKHVKVQLL